MGKFTASNLSDSLLENLRGSNSNNSIAVPALYVDADGGSDLNDGLTELTAFKTLSKVAEVISNKVIDYIKLDIYTKGTFTVKENEYIGFVGIKGNVWFQGQDLTTINIETNGQLVYERSTEFRVYNTVFNSAVETTKNSISSYNTFLNFWHCTHNANSKNAFYMQSYGTKLQLFYGSVNVNTNYVITCEDNGSLSIYQNPFIFTNNQTKIIKVVRNSTVSVIESNLIDRIHLNIDAYSTNNTSTPMNPLTDPATGLLIKSGNMITEGIKSYSQLPTGFYYFTTTDNEKMTDKLPASSGWYVNVYRANNDWSYIVARKNHVTEPYEYYRIVLTTDTGWVKTSGSAGSVLEENENENGHYIKYADGLIIMNFSADVVISTLKDVKLGATVNAQNRFTLKLPHDIVRELSSTLSGLPTNNTDTLFTRMSVQKRQVLDGYIYGHILDDTMALSTSFRSEIIRIKSLSYTVVGRWK